MTLRARFEGLPSPDALPLPSLLAVEVGVALVPYVALVVLSVVGGALFVSSEPGQIGGIGVWFMVLAMLAVVGLPVVLLVHAAVDIVRVGLHGVGEWTNRRAAHAAVRGLETVGAVLYLTFLREAWTTLDGLESEPAGAGIILAMAAGYVLLSGLVVAHGIGRVVLDS